jgi:hypothetical protein
MTVTTRNASRLSIVLLLSMFSDLARAQPSLQPATLSLVGGKPVAKAAEARRAELMGVVDVYNIAIYSAGGTVDRQALISAETPKAIRIVITYKEDLKRHLALDWRRELIPRLETAGHTHLQGVFGPLQNGDVVLVEYTPQKGTSARVNEGVAGSGASHDLMLSFLDHWMGQRPVSEDVKRQLIGQS